MIKSFIMALVAIISIAAICIAISIRSALAGFMVSLLGIIAILFIVALFIIPNTFEPFIRRDLGEVIDAEQ